MTLSVIGSLIPHNLNMWYGVLEGWVKQLSNTSGGHKVSVNMCHHIKQ